MSKIPVRIIEDEPNETVFQPGPESLFCGQVIEIGAINDKGNLGRTTVFFRGRADSGVAPVVEMTMDQLCDIFLEIAAGLEVRHGIQIPGLDKVSWPLPH